MNQRPVDVQTNVYRILLVDDHPLMREGLTEVLERDARLKVCGEADDRLSALQLIAEIRPDLVVVDLALKDSHGLELLKDMAVQFPHVPTLVVSMHEESINAERAIRAGASGYITKQEATTKILQAVFKVLAGDIYLSEKAAAQIAAKVVGRRKEKGNSMDCLTDRELQVFQMLGKGKTVRQIAAQLNLDVSTVETYRSRIKEKLNLKNSVELLQAAIEWNSNLRS